MAPPIAMLFSAADDNTYNWFIMHNSFHPRTPCKFWIRFWEGFPSWQEGIARGMFLWSQGYAEGGGRAIVTHVLLPGHQLESLHTPCCSYCFSKPWFPSNQCNTILCWWERPIRPPFPMLPVSPWADGLPALLTASEQASYYLTPVMFPVHCSVCI